MQHDSPSAFRLLGPVGLLLGLTNPNKPKTHPQAPQQTTWLPFAPTATRPPAGQRAVAPFPANASAADALAGVEFAEGTAEAADAGVQNCLQARATHSNLKICLQVN